MKQCSKCGEMKELEAFVKNADHADGRASRCKACDRAWREVNREKILARKRVWHEANREKIAARVRAYEEANREKAAARDRAWYEANREKRAAQMRAWREANREKIAVRQSTYRKANREEIAVQSRTYRKANLEKAAARRARRRALQRGAAVIPFTADELYDSYVERGLDACVYCGGPYEHNDHVIPLNRGGPHSIVNLVPSCTWCNLSKHTKLVSEWMPDHWLAASGE